jgi:hypothetical protein
MLFSGTVTAGTFTREGGPEKRKTETPMDVAGTFTREGGQEMRKTETPKDVVSASREAMHGLRIIKTAAKYKPGGITKKRSE